jgi:hypothetical protein
MHGCGSNRRERYAASGRSTTGPRCAAALRIEPVDGVDQTDHGDLFEVRLDPDAPIVQGLLARPLPPPA